VIGFYIGKQGLEWTYGAAASMAPGRRRRWSWGTVHFDLPQTGRTGLSLQIEELQGDFDRMQGGPKLGPAKRDQISIVWTASPYSRSREDIIFSREDHLGTGRRRSVLQSNANVDRGARR
jgi:hypothetical protein